MATSNTIYTICTLIKIDREDGVSLGFTSFNHDLTIDGVTYLANNAADPTAVEQKADLSTDNMEIIGFLDSSLVSQTDIANNVYDNALVTVALADFVTLPATINDATILASGRVGNIITTDSQFTFEINSLSEILNRPLHEQTSPLCRYREFGGSLCGLDLVANNLQLNATVTAVTETTITVDSTFLTDDFINGSTVFTTGGNQNRLLLISSVPSNNTFTIGTPLTTSVQIGETLTITAHCDRTQNTCNDYGILSGTDQFVNFGNVPAGGNFIPGFDRILTTVTNTVTKPIIS